MPTISRRAVMLGGVSAACLAFALPALADAGTTISADQFRSLSAKLAGARLADLDQGAAGRLLDGLLSLGKGTDLARLFADPAADAGALGEDIVAAWYSGNYQTAIGLASFGLPNALLWDALTFTKPSGFCGGLTGYWGDPPQS
jgi:hypothetical protein